MLFSSEVVRKRDEMMDLGARFGNCYRMKIATIQKEIEEMMTFMGDFVLLWN